MYKEDITDNNIQEFWKELSEKKFINNPIKKQDIMNAITKESNSDISILKKRLKYKLFYCVGFVIMFLVFFIVNYTNRDLSILFGIFTIAYIIGFIPMYIQYRKVEKKLSQKTSILDSMKHNLHMIQSVLKLEKIWGLIFFIPAVTGGLLLGKVKKGATLIECFSDPKLLLTMLGLCVVMVPLMIWASEKANKSAYGSLIENLKSNIVRLETVG